MDRDTLERSLSTALPEWNPVRIESLIEVSGGWESDVYDVRIRRGSPPGTDVERLALRRYAGGREVAQREYGGMRHLFAAGYPTARRPSSIGPSPGFPTAGWT